jgi:hypothetical protein
MIKVSANVLSRMIGLFVSLAVAAAPAGHLACFRGTVTNPNARVRGNTNIIKAGTLCRAISNARDEFVEEQTAQFGKFMAPVIAGAIGSEFSDDYIKELIADVEEICKEEAGAAYENLISLYDEFFSDNDNEIPISMAQRLAEEFIDSAHHRSRRAIETKLEELLLDRCDGEALASRFPTSLTLEVAISKLEDQIGRREYDLNNNNNMSRADRDELVSANKKARKALAGLNLYSRNLRLRYLNNRHRAQRPGSAYLTNNHTFFANTPVTTNRAILSVIDMGITPRGIPIYAYAESTTSERIGLVVYSLEFYQYINNNPDLRDIHRANDDQATALGRRARSANADDEDTRPTRVLRIQATDRVIILDDADKPTVTAPPPAPIICAFPLCRAVNPVNVFHCQEVDCGKYSCGECLRGRTIGGAAFASNLTCLHCFTGETIESTRPATEADAEEANNAAIAQALAEDDSSSDNDHESDSDYVEGEDDTRFL